ncbi:C45 family autoproteolytic acyltransferase/hydolase [Polluticaenibacter yanchengensis]|uniref:C45 family autoproteolytic acyltransferase/hydrolase n=1 Tax=Polluticaenibacter yanchengensis TaxID=3014562 RepID=A0ABT4UK49_9BACT|nr:C45 family autoproteolytic acyltransferase/hydrolase [Chitinophagaceae bacterium LY-5]
MNRYSILYILILSLFYGCGVSKSIHHQPLTDGYNATTPTVVRYSDSVFSAGRNYLLKNDFGQWEMYVSGDPLERGLAMGALYDSLYHYQEDVFFGKINELVPSKFRQSLLRQFLKFYNRKLYLNVPEEYKTEIYGVSRFASDNYDKIAPKYLRNLYLHGAHDIGHALEDLALVGCSSMAFWNEKTEDGKLLLGRNFDFYAGDDFAKNKIIAFIKPDSGYGLMMVTWPGMVGVVSGMNERGLTITMNAGKSKIPLVAKTPISIVARTILQYAGTIEEAVTIARRFKVFVSESLMVSSSKDRKAVLIEMSPKNFGVYDVPGSDELICTNHFQSSAYKEDKKNNRHILESHSLYRFERIEELLQNETQKMDPAAVAAILRNKEGLRNKPIGYGNEKSLNQLLAHHGIIFQPEDLKVWVSSSPYQSGTFVAYDLKAIFADTGSVIRSKNLVSLNIPADSFIYTNAYRDYEAYRVLDRQIDAAIKKKTLLAEDVLFKYRQLNPELWIVYYKSGVYYYNYKQYEAADNAFRIALSKEITTLPDKENIEKYLKKLKRKIK